VLCFDEFNERSAVSFKSVLKHIATAQQGHGSQRKTDHTQDDHRPEQVPVVVVEEGQL